MSEITKVVTKTCATLLLELICIVFGGQSSGGRHYVSLFATCPVKHDRGYERIQLKMSRKGGEVSPKSDAHFKLISFVITEGFWRSMNNIAAIVVNNYNTSRALSRNSVFSFDGCYSHGFDFSVCNFLNHYRELI